MSRAAARASLNPVLHIAALWRRQAAWLAFGALLSLGALAAGLALMGGAGHSLALALAGAVIFVPFILQAAGVARVVLRYLERVFTHEATFRALADLRLFLFAGLARSAAGGLGYRRTGDALARLVNDVDTLDGLYLRITVPLLGGLLALPVLAVLLYRASPWAVLALIPFAAVAFGLPLMAAAAARDSGPAAGLAMAGLRNAALDAVGGLREITIFGAQGRMLAAVQAREAALLAAQRELVRRVSLINAGGFLLGQGALLFVILIGLISPATASLVAVFVLIMGFEAVQGLPRAGVLFGQVQAAAARVVQAAQAPPPVAAPAAPAAMPAGTAIALEHVSFRYADDLPPVFENLSLQLPAGSRTAILGPSGAGKSTIAALLLKLVAPEAGHIRLGATDLAALPAEAVRARIAYLSQTTHLFADTIANNLRLGDPAATDEQLWAALDAAQLAETVRALPDGLNSWLGEGGGTLSGGQGRRLALARALLSPAPILILDEPCAGLDAETEMAFYRTLNAAIAGRSLLLIAHRLTGAEQLDRVWRLTGGQLVPATA
jgi:ATP-binding cassette subfamily C protein CydC